MHDQGFVSGCSFPNVGKLEAGLLTETNNFLQSGDAGSPSARVSTIMTPLKDS
jgi:hypothetical protein